MLIKGTSEAVEENLQNFLDPQLRTVIFNEEYDMPTLEEIVHTALVSFFSAGVLDAGEIADITIYGDGTNGINAEYLTDWAEYAIQNAIEIVTGEGSQGQESTVQTDNGYGIIYKELPYLETSAEPTYTEMELVEIGKAMLDMGIIPEKLFLDALGLDESTARGIQSLIWLSKENDPVAQRAVEEMINLTAPQTQLQQRQEADAVRVPVGVSAHALNELNGVNYFGEIQMANPDSTESQRIEGGVQSVDTGSLSVIEIKPPKAANDEWMTRGYDKAPYNTDYEVKVVRAGSEKFVRVFSYNADGTSNKLGYWLIRKRDIKGLSPAKIADKYALPRVPTHICDVILDPNIALQTGIANAVENWGNGGGQQFDTMGIRLPRTAFINERLIGE